jgi:hypothetical protein
MKQRCMLDYLVGILILEKFALSRVSRFNFKCSGLKSKSRSVDALESLKDKRYLTSSQVAE